ncbi:MAG: MEDS domain-containing protein [Methylophaga sp.]|nr:MEDS domain-containing protein [Methylophaga sp.]
MDTISTKQNELLNTRQAAELLNVSEISIRRWTKSGRLPCMRIGARRERRFNQRDLLNFLKIHSNERFSGSEDEYIEIAQKDLNIDPGKILLEGMSIEYGSHLCTVYETDKGIIKLSIPFLADGLRNGDKCYLIASETRQSIILEHLAHVYPDIDTAIKNKRLVMFEGITDSVKLYEYFETEFLSATQSGDNYIRVLGDMAWAVEKKMDIDELMSFEMKYNHSLCRKFPAISLCQYDARKFSGTEILNVLKNHDDTFNYPISRFIGF